MGDGGGRNQNESMPAADYQKRVGIRRRDDSGETLRSIDRSYNVSAQTIQRLTLIT